MGLLQLFLTSFGVAFSGAMAPGPLMAITMRHGVQKGPWAGLFISIGHGIIEIFMLVALVLASEKISILQRATSYIAVLGALVLAWMAWGSFREARSGTAGWMTTASSESASTTDFPSIPNQFGKPSWLPIIGAGAVATITNPYWALWWITIGVSYVAAAQLQGLPGLGAFFSGHISADIFCFIFFAAMASTGQRLLGQRFYRGLMLVLSVFLAIMALYFIHLALSPK